MSDKTLITVSHGASIIVDEVIDICECGEIPNFNIGYGRKPYSINCPCGKYVQNEITCTTPDGAIRAYNEWSRGISNKYNFKILRFKND